MNNISLNIDVMVTYDYTVSSRLIFYIHWNIQTHTHA